MTKRTPQKSAKKKILIVEDEKPIAKTLELKLQSSGFETTCALNGDEALCCIQKHPFDLILLDLVMPKKDGFEVLESLAKNDCSTPIFVITNLGQEEDAKRCKDLGAQEYFVKADVSIFSIVEKIQILFS